MRILKLFQVSTSALATAVFASVANAEIEMATHSIFAVPGNWVQSASAICEESRGGRVVSGHGYVIDLRISNGRFILSTSSDNFSDRRRWGTEGEHCEAELATMELGKWITFQCAGEGVSSTKRVRRLEFSADQKILLLTYGDDENRSSETLTACRNESSSPNGYCSTYSLIYEFTQDENPCSRVVRFSEERPKGLYEVVDFYWPSKAKTVVEYLDGKPEKINGQKVSGYDLEKNCATNQETQLEFCFKNQAAIAAASNYLGNSAEEPLSTDASQKADLFISELKLELGNSVVIRNIGGDTFWSAVEHFVISSAKLSETNLGSAFGTMFLSPEKAAKAISQGFIDDFSNAGKATGTLAISALDTLVDVTADYAHDVTLETGTAVQATVARQTIRYVGAAVTSSFIYAKSGTKGALAFLTVDQLQYAIEDGFDFYHGIKEFNLEYKENAISNASFEIAVAHQLEEGPQGKFANVGAERFFAFARASLRLEFNDQDASGFFLILIAAQKARKASFLGNSSEARAYLISASNLVDSMSEKSKPFALNILVKSFAFVEKEEQRREAAIMFLKDIATFSGDVAAVSTLKTEPSVENLIKLTPKTISEHLLSLDDGCFWLDMRPSHFYGLNAEQQQGRLSSQSAMDAWLKIDNDKLYAPKVAERDYWSGFLAATTEFDRLDSYERFSFEQAKLKQLARAGFIAVSGEISRWDDGTEQGRIGLKFTPNFTSAAENARVSQNEQGCFPVGRYTQIDVVDIQDQNKNNILAAFAKTGFASDLYRVALVKHVYEYTSAYRKYLSDNNKPSVSDVRQGIALYRYSPIEKQWTLVRFKAQDRTERLDMSIVGAWLTDES